MSEATNPSQPVDRASRRAAVLAMAGKLRSEPAILDTDAGPIDVLVRELSAEQAKDFETAVQRGSQHAYGMLIQLVLVDPVDGELLFEPADRGTIEQIGVSRLNDVAKVAQRLSGITEDDVEKAKRLLLNAPSNG